MKSIIVFFSGIGVCFLAMTVYWEAIVLQYDGLLTGDSESPVATQDESIVECFWVHMRYDQWQLQDPPTLCARRTDDALSNVIRSQGKWPDCDDLLKVLQASRPEDGGIFVDVGANIGSCTLLVAGQRFTTHAFEPQPDNLRYLRATLARLPGSLVSLHPVALGEAPGASIIFRQEGNAGNSVVGVVHPDDPTNARDQLEMERNAAHIEIHTLDEELWPGSIGPPPKILLVKIDVQGFEVKVLKGAQRLLNAGAIAAIKTELASAFLQAQGASQRDLCQIIAQAGFNLHNNPSGPEVSLDACSCMQGDLYAFSAVHAK